MDRLIVKLIGLALLVGGIYFLGKNVFFCHKPRLLLA